MQSASESAPQSAAGRGEGGAGSIQLLGGYDQPLSEVQLAAEGSAIRRKHS